MLKTSGSLFLGSQNVNDLKEAINAPENPIPIRALAVSSDKYVFEAAKIRMPANAMVSIPVRVFLAPYLSRNTPSGICVSPKASAPVLQISGQELKLVFPQAQALPDRFENLAFEHFWLQPMDGPDQAANTVLAMDYCLTHPRWRLSIQTHKYIGVR